MRQTKVISVLLLLTNGLFAQNMVKYADSIRKIDNIPELAFAVVTGDSIVEMSFSGYHSINLPDTASATDRFHIGSNTKAMTGFVIAKIVEEGKLNWNTKFFDVFPEWKRASDTGYYNITLQDLLSHTARIHSFTDDKENRSIPLFKGDKLERRKAFGKYLLTLKPINIDAGLHYTYSNAGYILATLMAEKVTNKNWEELITIVFNQNLKINVQLGWPDNQTKKDTWGHWIKDDSLRPVPSTVNYHMDYAEPACDINLTLPDYIKFIQLNLNGLNGKNNYLQSTTYNFIHKGLANYAIGWANINEKGKDFSTHSGSEGTYFVTTSIDRKNHIAYIIFMNTATEDTINGIRELLKTLKLKYGS
jgi:CubicO group peptidase (beta-lactamase class C family)